MFCVLLRTHILSEVFCTCLLGQFDLWFCSRLQFFLIGFSLWMIYLSLKVEHWSLFLVYYFCISASVFQYLLCIFRGSDVGYIVNLWTVVRGLETSPDTVEICILLSLPQKQSLIMIHPRTRNWNTLDIIRTQILVSFDSAYCDF